ncbi:MAG: tRNA epoxyqueuosine(34) reductase QueG [Nitrospira sp. NTP2]|nr:tRNA epoxyqueuosine(34) reductase QueG [Nitrospira sp. NTP2]
MAADALTEHIKQAALDLGFSIVGISTFLSGHSTQDSAPNRELFPDQLGARLREWLRRGYQATMAWMARDPDRRTNPSHVLPGCRSIISVGMNYHTARQADERPGNGRIARYAWGRDYHRILGDRLDRFVEHIDRLAPGSRHRAYVDTGPVMEKAWAQQAGLGWIGKHSNLVSPRFGSWLLLGEILTTLELTPDEPGTDLCGTCTLCIQACPTGAITEPYVVDAGRCISYLTIELRGSDPPLPDDLRRGIGNKIFGCDDCLDVCPYNLQADPTQEPGFQPSPLTAAPSLEALAQLDEPAFAAAFRESPIRRAKHIGFQRNLAWAMANQQRRSESVASDDRP